MSNLSVYYEQRKVGTIEVFADGPSFVYAPEWLGTRGAFPLSFLMPLSPTRVPASIFEPWAANLLPEADNLHAIGRRLGASPGDVVAILSEIGRDTAGALSIGRPGTSAMADWRPIDTEAELERIIDDLPNKPFLAGDEGVSMSLAGVQTKLSVAVSKAGDLCIPLNGAPSTRILKPGSSRLHGSVANEAMCLVLARLCGLSVPAVTTGRAGNRTYLLVVRYDRLEQNDVWRRLHQEDFCQALGKPPSAKYESSASGVRGPNLAEMFALTRSAMGASDVIRLLDYVLFNILVCNTDAHAKNYSMMISGRGFSLAPIYDVLCAAVWDSVTVNLAQKIDGKNCGDHIKRRHWQRFAAACSLNAPQVLKRVEEMANLVGMHAPAAAAQVAAMPAGPHDVLHDCVAAIRARVRAIKLGLADMEGVTPPKSTRKTSGSATSGKPRQAKRKIKAATSTE